jgi:hypothetical protein
LEEEQLIIYSSNHYSQQLIEGSRQAAQPVRYMGHFEFFFFLLAKFRPCNQRASFSLNRMTLNETLPTTT